MDCRICVSGFTLSGTDCVSFCPSNQYSFNNICTNCFENCTTCYDGNETSCYSCAVGTFKSVFVNTCVVDCLSGQYKNVTTASNPLCSLCDASCVTCFSNSTNCTKCLTISSIIQTYLYHVTGSYSVCLTSCPSGYFGQLLGLDSNIGSNICTGCDSACLTCNGTGNINCQSCALGKFLGLGTSICSDGCPQGQYIDPNVDYVCVVCNLGCAICSGSASNCDNCQ
jgi:proprotein convertase subtilisin/kexin type 5